MELPPANILIPLERQLIALQLCRWQFLYNQTLQQTSHPLLSKLSERRQIYVFDPHFEEVRGGIETWSMACWKANVDFLLTVSELLFLSVTVDALQGKTCQKSLWRGGSVWAKGRPWEIFFGFYKTRHILLSDSANCTVLCAVVLTEYWRVTHRQIDGIAVATTVLAMRALWRAVKSDWY